MMEVLSAIALLLVLAESPCAEQAWGEHPPCWQCDSIRDTPIQEIRSHCIYPCECVREEPACEAGVLPVTDGCGCCPICPRQLGQPCDKTSVCDEQRGLFCHYAYIGASVGICQGRQGLPCTVANTTYSHGETFHMDCRTQCTCQNGTYGCSSLCPNEIISPRAACEHPRLVDVPDQCCREWMCDSTEAEHPPSCKQEFTSWSDCSAQCGLGTSHRMSNVNGCVLMNETRICQLRPCEAGMLASPDHSKHHHIRKGHECKATQRVAGPVRLRFGPCRSKKRYRPRFCGHCADRAYDGCCIPQLSTTIRVEFICDGSAREADSLELEDLLEPGRDLWWPDDLLALRVASTEAPTINDTQVEFSVHQGKKMLSPDSGNFDELRQSVGWSLKKSRSPSEQNSLLDRSVKLSEIRPDVYNLERPHYSTETSARSSVAEITTKVSPEEPTTSKPKKRKKKKPHKPFTSWLEFRDEEYQMDEYEDYEDKSEDRPKRSAETDKGSFLIGGKHVKEREVRTRTKRGSKQDSNQDKVAKVKQMKIASKKEGTPSRLKSASDFKIWRTIKSHMSKGITPVKIFDLGRKARRQWRTEKKRDRRRRKGQKKENTRGTVGKGEDSSENLNHLSKMERIIRGRDPGGNLTRSWWISEREKRHTRPAPLWQFSDVAADGRTVSVNVQWIVKCACDRACALATTTPSELSADGEIVLRRVHRTAPP